MVKRGFTVAALVAVIGVLGCGPSEKALEAEAEAKRQAEWTWLEGAKRDLDAKRGELAALQAREAAGEDVAAQVTALHTQVDADEDALGQRLAGYINDNPPVVGEPLNPDQVAAIRMKSSEDMVIAKEFIDMGGDYRKAIEIYQSALVADPDNAELKSALEQAKASRYMSRERFAGVKKGMTEAQVRLVLGVPYHRNVKDYPEKKVSAWFYPTNEANDAAGVYFNAKKEVYEVKFDAIQVSKGGQG